MKLKHNRNLYNADCNTIFYNPELTRSGGLCEAEVMWSPLQRFEIQNDVKLTRAAVFQNARWLDNTSFTNK